MRSRSYLFLLFLFVLGVSLIPVTIAWAAAPTSSSAVPGWAVGVGGTLVVLLFGVIAFLVKRWMDGRERFERAVLSGLTGVNNNISDLRSIQGVLVERVDSLPCRKAGPKNGTPSSPLRCILKEMDYETDH